MCRALSDHSGSKFLRQGPWPRPTKRMPWRGIRRAVWLSWARNQHQRLGLAPTTEPPLAGDHDSVAKGPSPGGSQRRSAAICGGRAVCRWRMPPTGVLDQAFTAALCGLVRSHRRVGASPWPDRRTLPAPARSSRCRSGARQRCSAVIVQCAVTGGPWRSLCRAGHRMEIPSRHQARTPKNAHRTS